MAKTPTRSYERSATNVVLWTAILTTPSVAVESRQVDLSFLTVKYGLRGVPTTIPLLEVDYGYDYGPLWTGSVCNSTEFDLDETYHPPAIRCPDCQGDRNHSVILIGLDDPGKDPLGKKGWGKSPLLHWAISNLNGTKLQDLREYELLVDEGLEIAEYRHPYPKFGCQRYAILITEEPAGWRPPFYEDQNEIPRRNWPVQQWLEVHNKQLKAGTCFQTCHIEDPEDDSGTCSAL